jgi:hypothetical protein
MRAKAIISKARPVYLLAIVFSSSCLIGQHGDQNYFNSSGLGFYYSIELGASINDIRPTVPFQEGESPSGTINHLDVLHSQDDGAAGPYCKTWHDSRNIIYVFFNRSGCIVNKSVHRIGTPTLYERVLDYLQSVSSHWIGNAIHDDRI